MQVNQSTGEAVQPAIIPRTRYPRRNRGCLSMFLFAGLIAFALCTFCTLGSLTLYLLFPPPSLDLLVLGLDARPGEGNLTRTDVIMLVGVQPRRLKVSVLSIPRDVFINVPGYGLQRINTINVLGEQASPGGGIDLLAAALQQEFKVGVDRSIRLNFQAFVDLVDAVGGISVDVPARIVDYAYPTMDGGTQVIEFESGTQQMDGERALIYARTRHADDDYQRAGRQQQVVSAVAVRLLNPLTWGPALQILNQYTETDLTFWDLLRYAPVLLVQGGQFDRLVVNREYLSATGGGVTPDYPRLLPWVSERFD